MQRCSSPFVVKIFERWSDGLGTMVLELLRPLQVPLRSQARWPAAGLFYGLAYIHAKSICHRDIKVENLLQTATGQVKLADFGCAASTHAGSACPVGSFKTWAPEVHHPPYNGREADVWAGGVCVRELICGLFPFRGRAPREIRHGITVAQMAAKIAAGPRSVVLRVLSVDPSKQPTAACIAAMFASCPFQLPARKRRRCEPGALARGFYGNIL